MSALPARPLDVDPVAQAAGPIGRVRWTICGLLFAASTINYIDRQVLGLLAPDLQRTIGWDELQYGYIVSAFQAAYAIGFIFAGQLMDRLGTRRGYAIAVGLWSLAAMSAGFAVSALTFGMARFALGLGESGNFPAAIKTTAEWFPKRERAFATGIFNSGTNIGAVIAPLTVPWIALTLGWRWAFVLTGAIGFIWVAVWLKIYAPARQPSEAVGAGAPAHPERPRTAGNPGGLAAAVRLPPDVGRHGRQVHDRSDLVVLSVLAAEVPARQLRPDVVDRGAAARDDLPVLRRRQHLRRVAVVAADHARLERQRGAQDRDVHLRDAGDADCARLEGEHALGGGRR